MKIPINYPHDPYNLSTHYFFKESGVDPYECKKYIGEYRSTLFDPTKRKVVNVFWSTPCGYWTLCWVLEGLDSPLLNNQILNE